MTSPSAWPRSRPRSSAARRSCSTTTRWSGASLGSRRVDPYQLLFQAHQFYLVGHSHERKAIRVFRLSRIQGKVGYATKAEHDFQRPADFDPRVLREPDRLAVRRPGGHGGGVDRAPHRLADRAPLRPLRRGATGRGGRRPSSSSRPYANARQLIAWVLGLGEHARIIGPPELADELRERIDVLIERHAGEPQIAAVASSAGGADADGAGRATPATATTPRARSAPSGSRGWSRWPAS